MTDFFEIDLLDVETKKSGDAIALRYTIGGVPFIHVVDGGYQEKTGPALVQHIKTYYGNPSRIDNVVATHNDGDHTGGLREVLETFDVGTLWMLRPWHYADELIDRFPTYSSVAHLVAHLKGAYANLAALEEIAERKGIQISEPFQGATIGAFRVLAPSRSRFLELVLASDKTPQASVQNAFFAQARETLRDAASAVAYAPIVTKYVHSAWGIEIFSTEGLKAENEMSVVQYANLCDQRILLTGDAGCSALTEAADFAPLVGLNLPGIDKFQVPHHGSRRNVSTAILDRWLGERLQNPLAVGQEKFVGMISSALEDKDHPRKAVVRSMYHRGGVATATEGSTKCFGYNAPYRGWGPAIPVAYPWDQEE